MGREVKRVPLNFDWPLNKVWAGYRNPYWEAQECEDCGGGGYNPETREIADSWYDHGGFIAFRGVELLTERQLLIELKGSPGRWTYHYGYAPDGSRAERPPWKVVGDCRSWQFDLKQDEVDSLVENGRLVDLWKTYQDGSWKQSRDLESNPVTAAEVNEWAKCGVAASDGRVVFMTTNHKDRLDPALIRAGRADVHVRVDNPTGDQAARMFWEFFPDRRDLAARLKKDWDEGCGMSMADLQEHFLNNRLNAEAAVRVGRSTEG